MKHLIVDENLHENSPLLGQFRQSPTGRLKDLVYEFLIKTRPGIPDVEILTKILNKNTILLTRDRMLHTQAMHLGFHSVYMDDAGICTSGKLPGFVPKALPQSAHVELKDDYSPRAHPIASRFWSGLTEKRAKGYRTSRRRIRSSLGSAAAIKEISVVIDSLDTKKGMLCGFAIWIYPRDPNATKLRATEGYCIPAAKMSDPAMPLLFAIRDILFLHLDPPPIQLYVAHADSLQLAQKLKSAPTPPQQPLHALLHAILQAIPSITLLPCGKGPKLQAMQQKLKALASFSSNEVQTLDFIAMGAASG